MLQQFRIPALIGLAAVIVSGFLWGVSGAITVGILSILEISFSFDNAIVNAKVLKRLSPHYQKLFLTVGVLIAVFGMRLLFPLIVVTVSARMNPVQALRLAIAHPHTYAHDLSLAHPAIAAFGGVFLLMLFWDWLFEEREVSWLKPIEQRLFLLGKVENMSVILTGTILVLATIWFGHSAMVLLSGLLGLIAYLIVSSLDSFFSEDNVMAAKASLATFLYLEVLDASFSFDGVVGAFAVSSNIFMIAIGLGVGAMFIRQLTVYLTNEGILSEFRYLEHGAHWAIGILSLLLLATIRFDIPDVVTGLLGVILIGSAFIHSIAANHLDTHITGEYTLTKGNSHDI